MWVQIPPGLLTILRLGCILLVGRKLMIKNHTPESRMPARTTFAFTDTEVSQALVNYVKSRGETVPDGNWQVWTRDHAQPMSLTLVIDHKDKEID